MPTIDPLYAEMDDSRVEDKINEIIKQTNRNSGAIMTMASWLVQAQTGFGEKDARGIIEIVEGDG